MSLIPASLVSDSADGENQQGLPLHRVEWTAEQRPDQAFQLGRDDRLWSGLSDRSALLAAVDHSLDYLRTSTAVEAYQRYPVPNFSLSRVRLSLERFRQLVLKAQSSAELQSEVSQEFALYQSIGSDRKGTVSFTGYFEPTYRASRFPTPEFRYPLYRLPANLGQWRTPHPTRVELEGSDGLKGSQGRLRGLELVWLPSRLEAYLTQVQGSARLQLTDNSVLSVGYAGQTNYPYVSIGRELVKASKIAEADLTLTAVIQYFHQHPEDLDVYLPRNNRFIFFQATTDSRAVGSLGVPVTAERSIATDKALMPPGALAFIQIQPRSNPQGNSTQTSLSRYVLDQDTGGAIRGAGRVDLFMGTGADAGDRAGQINRTGQLYYLLLKQ